MAMICEHCVADKTLRIEILERGIRAEECEICGFAGGQALPASDAKIRDMVRALVKIRLSGWQYCEGFRTKPIANILFEEGRIFASSITNVAAAVAFVDECLINKAHERINIPLYGAPPAIESEMSFIVQDFLKKSQEVNYFDLKPSLAALLDDITRKIEFVVPEKSAYFRARLGVEYEHPKISFSLGRWSEPLYAPYAGKNISAPPVVKATSGRLNRRYLPVLYLASDTNTAVSELKPHPGDHVSVSTFTTTKNLRIAKFEVDYRDFLSDHELRLLNTIASLNMVISAPVPPDQQEPYIFTQLLSDVVRDSGFDGIIFSSSITSGENLVLFNQHHAEPLAGSEEVWKVDKMQYILKPLTLYSEETARKEMCD